MQNGFHDIERNTKENFDHYTSQKLLAFYSSEFCSCPSKAPTVFSSLTALVENPPRLHTNRAAVAILSNFQRATSLQTPQPETRIKLRNDNKSSYQNNRSFPNIFKQVLPCTLNGFYFVYYTSKIYFCYSKPMTVKSFNYFSYELPLQVLPNPIKNSHLCHKHKHQTFK